MNTMALRGQTIFLFADNNRYGLWFTMVRCDSTICRPTLSPNSARPNGDSNKYVADPPESAYPMASKSFLISITPSMELLNNQ